jgi:HD-GYP domain-containing protein (c-di-GMP phosphodiesterase class II)
MQQNDASTRKTGDKKTLKKTKKPRALTTKQLKFIKAKVEGKTGVEAAMEAYGVTSYRSANTVATSNMQKVAIKDALEAVYERQGITLDRIIAPINRALEAKKIVGIGENEKEVHDHSVQLKAASIAGSFLGIGRNTEGGNTVNFIAVQNKDTQSYDL